MRGDISEDYWKLNRVYYIVIFLIINKSLQDCPTILEYCRKKQKQRSCKNQ